MSRTRTERESNQKAVVALVALMGGPEGYRSRGLSLQGFKPIFEADPMMIYPV